MRSSQGCVALDIEPFYMYIGMFLIFIGLALTCFSGVVQEWFMKAAVQILMIILTLAVLFEVGFIQLQLTPYYICLQMLGVFVALSVACGCKQILDH